MQAVVVFAHGSRDPLWHRPIEAVAQRIAARHPAALVGSAFLELTEPSLPQTVQRLVALGATELRVLPLFFGMGKHAREDLPELMAALRLAHPAVRFDCLPAAGESDRLLDLLAELALEPLP